MGKKEQPMVEITNKWNTELNVTNKNNGKIITTARFHIDNLKEMLKLVKIDCYKKSTTPDLPLVDISDTDDWKDLVDKELNLPVNLRITIGMIDDGDLCSPVIYADGETTEMRRKEFDKKFTEVSKKIINFFK